MRAIFPNVDLIKKNFTERFLVSLQEIYRHSPVYTYSDKEEDTEVYIYPSYTDINFPGKKPRFIVKPGGYSFSLTDTLFNNMSGEIQNLQGITAGFSYDKMLSSSVTITVEAYAEEESSDLADEIVMLTVFSCRSMFGQNKLSIRGAEASATMMTDNAQNIYQTMVSVGFDFPWRGEITSDAPSILNADATVEPVTDAGSTRMPGIEVYRLAIQQQNL